MARLVLVLLLIGWKTGWMLISWVGVYRGAYVTQILPIDLNFHESLMNFTSWVLQVMLICCIVCVRKTVDLCLFNRQVLCKLYSWRPWGGGNCSRGLLWFSAQQPFGGVISCKGVVFFGVPVQWGRVFCGVPDLHILSASFNARSHKLWSSSSIVCKNRHISSFS